MNMKTYKDFYCAVIFLLTLTLCSTLFCGCKKSYNPATDATSQICSQVKGTEAVYWDLMNGIARTDIPGGLPTISTAGGTYSNPSFALLTFIYPAGYTPYTDNNPGWIGANLIRNDQKSIWRYSSLFTGTAYTTQYILNAEVTNLRSFLGSTGTITTVCAEQGTLPRAPGIVTSGQSVYLTFDGFSAVVQVSITTETGLNGEQVNVTVTAAPTTEFANEILHTYLPIDYQMLYKSDGELDSDGDGYPDSIDAYPFDPTRH